MRGQVRWVLLTCLIGCGGAQETEPTAQPDPARATAEVDAVIKAQYAAIAAGDTAGWAEPFTAETLVWGSAPGELWIGHDEALRETLAFIKPITDAGGSFSGHSVGPWVLEVSADGRAAWFADEAELVATVGNERTVTPMRASQVLVKGADGHWHTTLWLNSTGVPNDRAFAIAAAGKWPALAPVPDRVDPGAEEIVRQVDRDLADPEVAMNDITSDGSAYMFGSAPEEKGRVDDALKQQTVSDMKSWQISTTRKDGIHVGIAPGGTLAWAAFNAEITVHIDGNAVTQPYRGLIVYRKEGDAWRTVHWHWSNGVPNEGLPAI